MKDAILILFLMFLVVATTVIASNKIITFDRLDSFPINCDIMDNVKDDSYLLSFAFKCKCGDIIHVSALNPPYRLRIVCNSCGNVVFYEKYNLKDEKIQISG